MQQKTVHEIFELVYKIINDIDCPRRLKGYLVKRSELHDRNFRDSSLIDGMRAKSTMGQCTFIVRLPVNGILYQEIFEKHLL